MTARTPAETLRAAADRLDENAAAERAEAPFGPWMIIDPDAATPLASWLRDQAALVEYIAERRGSQIAETGSTQHALAVARVVLGETPTPDTRED